MRESSWCAGWARRSLWLAALAASLPVCAAVSGSDAALARFDTPDFALSLQASSQTLVSLAPKGTPGFDFAPSGRFARRRGDGFYRLGDLDLRVRVAGDANAAWQDYSTAQHRLAIRALPARPGELASADIGAAFGPGQPLAVTRTWAVVDGRLTLRFTLANPGAAPIEVGGLGVPMIFDNVMTDRTLEQAHEQASFQEPYVGEDAGYLQVTRLNGRGPVLLVLPAAGAPFELYKPILDEKDAQGHARIYNDPLPREATFEGFYDWMVAAKGFADTDWKGVRQWNEPTSFTLQPGATRTIALRFVLAPSVRAIESTLIAAGRPVAVGLPGYVAPTDLPVDLFLHAPSPVASIAVSPAGALDVVAAGTGAKPGWVRYAVTGKAAGNARLTLTYADGSVQTVHYRVTKPEREAVADMGRFLTTRQWFDDASDPFHRAPSVLTYDRERDALVTTDTRVWIAGLGDEGGSGSWLAALMKELDNPDAAELAKLEAFANETLWGRLQVSSGDTRYGVRKSAYWYQPDQLPAGTYDPSRNWKTWTSWNAKTAASLGRAYNYPHVAAAWWVLYRTARFHAGLATREPWQTYLTRSAETIRAMMRDAPEYTQFGLMEGDVFVAILGDLRREGMTAEADAVEALMKQRVHHWLTERYPFGSEMPWDSTGQAEVYAWMHHFGHEEQAAATREVILAYDPTIPHWGYNGSARRFWDFLYAGKLQRIERQLHHYGSALNALPLFDAYRADPSDLHLLRVAYGGLMGSLTNIDADGFAGAAFHSFPDQMRFDAINGDYGMSFYGHAMGAASYLVDDPTFGWIAFGARLTAADGALTFEPRDSARSRVFIAPAGLWITLDAGKVRSVRYEPATGRVALTLEAGDVHTPTAYVAVQVTTKTGRAYSFETALARERGAWAVPLGSSPRTLVLAPR